MKTMEFDESQLSDLQALGRMLLQDAQDPRSTAYVRVLNRPKISWLRVILCTLLPVLAAAALGMLLAGWKASAWLCIVLPLGLLAGYALVMAKRAVICMIRIYQRFAPDALRNKCRFEPSCSEYAILSLQKYGLLRGLRKSIHRLQRCNIHNGGFDYP